MAPTQATDGFDIAIAGGGVGGLACAAALSRKGLKILLAESSSTLGGCLTAVNEGAFDFVWPTHRYHGCESGAAGALLAEMGIAGNATFERVQSHCRFVFPDDELSFEFDISSLQESLERKFPAECSNIQRLFKEIQLLYQEVSDVAAGIGAVDWLVFPIRYPRVIKYASRTFESMVNEYVTDRRAQAMICGFWFTGGVGPARMSAMVMTMRLMSQMSQGSYFLKGGAQSLVDVMAAAIRCAGGEIRTACPVTRIIIENNRAAGIRMDGATVRTRAVVSNIDATTTFNRLIGEDETPAEIRAELSRHEPSLSAVKIFFGVRNDALPDRDEDIYLFDSYDMNALFDKMIGNYGPAVCRISIQGSQVSTAGRIISAESLLSRSANTNVAEWLEALEQKAVRVVPELAKSGVVLSRYAVTPAQIEERTGNRDGAIYGWAHYPDQIGLRRLKQSTPIKDLYLAGHWTTPGGGVMTAINSGVVAAGLIDRKYTS